MWPQGFKEELKHKAGVMFDWTREGNPEAKEKKMNKCLTDVETLLEKRNLVCTA